METWIEIPTLPGYFLSSNNRVRKYDPRTTEYYYLAGGTNSEGFKNYKIKGKSFALHKIICMVHHPEKTVGIVDFINNNTNNLSPNNLKWRTTVREKADLNRIAKSNIYKKPKQKRTYKVKPKFPFLVGGENQYTNKLTEQQVLKIRSTPHLNKHIIADIYKVKWITIHRILTNEIWKNLL
jgi:hypothetical protein